MGLLVFSASSRAQTPLPIFADSLTNGWQSYGWATLNYANTAPVHSGTYSISVTAGPYEALYLHHASFSAAPYTNLTFWIHGGTAGGQRLKIQGLLGGVAQRDVSLAAPVANTWQQRTVSLAALGVAGQPNFDGFWIQSLSGSSIPTFYVDVIELTPSPLSPATIRVNASQAVRTVDARLFGINAAIWDSHFDTAQTRSLLAEMDCKILRFPGGSLSDEYHWAVNRTGTNSWQWVTSFGKFARVATNLGVQAMITVNYGSGTPAEAAAWVRHANVTNHYAFKYWEIGNENYGEWEKDTNQWPHDAYTYAVRAREYIAQMKAADPTIEIGVPVVTGESDYANGYTNHPAQNLRTGQIRYGWTPVLLSTFRELGVTPDFLVYHRYAQGPWGESDALLLQSSASWANDALSLRQMLGDYLGPAGTNVELLCTENNSVYSNPGKQTTSLVNGLFLADSVCQLMQTEFRALVWWDLRNGKDTNNNNSAALYGWREYGDYGIIGGATERYPAFYAFKLLQYFARGGDQVLGASGGDPWLSGYAARRSDGTLSLLAVNKDPVNVRTAQIELQGFAPESNAVVRAYGIAQDEAARTGTGDPDLVMTNFSGAAGSFSYGFAPYSVTVLSLRPRYPWLEFSNRNSMLTLRWPIWAETYKLAVTTNLIPAAWAPVTNAPVEIGGSWTVTLPIEAGNRFYRLQAP